MHTTLSISESKVSVYLFLLENRFLKAPGITNIRRSSSRRTVITAMIAPMNWLKERGPSGAKSSAAWILGSYTPDGLFTDPAEL